MDGKALKDWIKRNGITQDKAAEMLGMSRQTLTTWISKAEFAPPQKARIIEALSMPGNFFDQSISQIGEGNAVYGNTDGLLAECEKERAVLAERVLQLELRLKEKDAHIKTITKQLKG